MVFLVGVLWSRANDIAAISVLRIGFVLGMVKFVTDVLYRSFEVHNNFVSFLAEIHFLHFAIFLFGISTVLMVVISLKTKVPEKEKVNGFTLKYANEIVKEESYKQESGKYRKLNMIATAGLVVILSVYWWIFN